MIKIDLLLSIKPKYAMAILAGFKRFEYRRVAPLQPVNTVFLYASDPTKQIVGSFKLGITIYASPEDLWMCTGKEGGISKEDLFEYFDGRERGYALEAKDPVTRLDPPVDPWTDRGFRPPQNYTYILHPKQLGLCCDK